MPIVALVIGSVLVCCAGIALFLWSRWADREASYDPEQLSEEEASVYRLGGALGMDPFGGGGH